ncbi:MAG: hypothetical protein ACE5NW_10040 [Acidiferrobacterales bacterium]
MNSVTTKAITALCMGVAVCTYPVQAAVTDVAASPSSRSVQLGRTAAVSLRWAATTDDGDNTTVHSTEGVFLTPNAVTLGTIRRPVSTSMGGSSVAVLSETTLVPKGVIDKAHQMGFDKLIYQRRFDDGAGSSQGQITLNIARPLAGGFSISRLTLQFDDGTPLRIVPANNPLQVQANIGFDGSGYLQATWELAGPESAVTPVYRPLHAVRHYLTGSEPIVLISPELPTDMVGHYRVRLRINNPPPRFDIPVIQYVIGNDKG